MPHGSCWTSGSLFLVLSLNLGGSPSVCFLPLGDQVLRRSVCVQLRFLRVNLKFCFGYTGNSYLSLSRLCHDFFCLLSLYIESAKSHDCISNSSTDKKK
jgi:hypothetical protein